MKARGWVAQLEATVAWAGIRGAMGDAWMPGCMRGQKAHGVGFDPELVSGRACPECGLIVAKAVAK